MPFIPFSCLVALVKSSNTMLNRNSASGKSCLVPDLRRKAFNLLLLTVRTRQEKMDWFQNGKGVRQGCILSLCLFNLYAQYIMRNAGLNVAQTGIKISGRNINNLDM